MPVVLDEYETISDLIGLREIVKPPSKGHFIIISQVPLDHKFPFEIKKWDFPVMTVDDMRKVFPDAPLDLLEESKGDLRFVERGLTFRSDKPDEFKSPREFITDLVSKYKTVSPMKYIGHPIQEPGNMVSILQENYLDAKGVDLVKVTGLLSEADVVERAMYNDGHWQLLGYYNLMGCLMPAMEIGHRLDPAKMRPGQLWTKYQNACMREKRLMAISDKNFKLKLDNQALLLLRDYAEKGELDVLREHKIEPKDIDIFNYISPLRKLSAKTISALKKNI